MALKTKKFIPRIIILRIVFNEFHHLSSPFACILTFSTLFLCNCQHKLGSNARSWCTKYPSTHGSTNKKPLPHSADSKIILHETVDLTGNYRAGSPMGFRPEIVKKLFLLVHVPSQTTNFPTHPYLAREKITFSPSFSSRVYCQTKKCSLWFVRQYKGGNSLIYTHQTATPLFPCTISPELLSIKKK